MAETPNVHLNDDILGLSTVEAPYTPSTITTGLMENYEGDREHVSPIESMTPVIEGGSASSDAEPDFSKALTYDENLAKDEELSSPGESSYILTIVDDDLFERFRNYMGSCVQNEGYTQWDPAPAVKVYIDGVVHELSEHDGPAAILTYDGTYMVDIRTVVVNQLQALILTCYSESGPLGKVAVFFENSNNWNYEAPELGPVV